MPVPVSKASNIREKTLLHWPQLFTLLNGTCYLGRFNISNGTGSNESNVDTIVYSLKCKNETLLA